MVNAARITMIANYIIDKAEAGSKRRKTARSWTATRIGQQNHGENPQSGDLGWRVAVGIYDFDNQ